QGRLAILQMRSRRGRFGGHLERERMRHPRPRVPFDRPGHHLGELKAHGPGPHYSPRRWLRPTPIGAPWYRLWPLATLHLRRAAHERIDAAGAVGIARLATAAVGAVAVLTDRDIRAVGAREAVLLVLDHVADGRTLARSDRPAAAGEAAVLDAWHLTLVALRGRGGAGD